MFSVPLDRPARDTVNTEMGTFRTDIEVENPAKPGARHLLRAVLVDTGAELSWIPATVLETLGIARRKVWRFRQADGTVLERATGYAIVHVGDTETTDEVVPEAEATSCVPTDLRPAPYVLRQRDAPTGQETS